MKVFESLNECQQIPNPVLTLGVYDGVHIGHQTIIQYLNEIAEKCKGESVLLSFEPHPRLVLQPNPDLELLTIGKEKQDLLEKYGLNNLIIHPFTKSFSQLSSEEFVKDFLVDILHIHTIVIGHDHHFGKNREGNYEQLQKLSEKYGFNVIQLPAVKEGDVVLSSTKIRKALLAGDITFANAALGHNYSLEGEVIHGDKIGRTLGFPTANLSVGEHKLIPGNGVYAVKVNVGNQVYNGLVSIGVRPTVTQSNEKRVEVFILDFSDDLYGQIISIEFLGLLRMEQKFDSLDELINQMHQDEEKARRTYFS